MGAAGSKGGSLVNSIEVTAASGESGPVRRHPNFKDSLGVTAYPDVTTVYEAFQRGLKLSRARNCMAYRKIETKLVDGKEVKEAGAFIWYTYDQVAELITQIGSGILQMELAPANEHGDHLVGLYSKNRYEWSVTQHALHAYSLTSVPLYDTLGEQAVSFIVNQTSLATVFCSKAETSKLISFKKKAADTAKSSGEPDVLAALKNVVQFEDDLSEEIKAQAAAAGLTLRTFSEVAHAGGFNKKPHNPPKPDDKAVICYTSGTTGNPKGVIMTHKNLIADASAAVWANLGIGQDDIHLSYLPLAHIFEQLVENAIWMHGGQVAFYQGDSLKIMDDLKALRPTIFPSVPRLFNKIYDKIMGGVNAAGGLKAAMFNQGFAAKQARLKNSGSVTHGLWDSLVFGKVAARVGLDRCKLFVSGSAPLAPHVMEFLRVVFSCNLVEGYGQTECGGAATVQNIYDQASLGHVGGPVGSNEVKLVSVPDMGYLITDTVHGLETDASGKVVNPGIPCHGRGEVCYRGTNIFPGYYLDAEKTAEAIDSDGWLHSGDIGLWDKNGNLAIVDRKKNIFKLSQGEYVAAEKIENVYLKCSYVAQAFVYGDSLHSMLIGVFVPDFDILVPWAKKNGKGEMTHAQLCADEAVKKLVLEDLVKTGKEAKLQSFEQVKDLHLEPEAWTPENILTPSFKLKRVDAKKQYQAQINALYAKLDPVAGKKELAQGKANN